MEVLRGGDVLHQGSKVEEKPCFGGLGAPPEPHMGRLWVLGCPHQGWELGQIIESHTQASSVPLPQRAGSGQLHHIQHRDWPGGLHEKPLPVASPKPQGTEAPFRGQQGGPVVGVVLGSAPRASYPHSALQRLGS